MTLTIFYTDFTDYTDFINSYGYDSNGYNATRYVFYMNYWLLYLRIRQVGASGHNWVV